MPNWKKIKAEYIRGGVSYRELAQKYGVSPSTLSKIAMKEKWADLRKKTGIKLDTKLSDSVASQEAERVDKIQSLADILIDKITERIEDGTFITDSQGTRQIVSALKDLREIKGMKSDLDKQEQIARINKLKKEAEANNNADKEIKIVIAGELEDYAK